MLASPIVILTLVDEGH